MANARFWLHAAMASLAVVLIVTPASSFQISTQSRVDPSAMMIRGKSSLTSKPLQLPSTVVRSSNGENEDAGNYAGQPNLDVGGILGTLASFVVLRSEFVLKTTGCGLPAGPFGIVGAIEGVSYLGVVATCAAAAVDYFSKDQDLGGSTSNPSRLLATVLSASAVAIGIAVLAFQIVDYGYIPNAVPMEGGMCQ